MRTSLALICALALIASPYFFAYLEVERMLGLPEAVWLPLLTIVFASLITSMLLWAIGLFSEPDSHRDS